MSNLLLLAMVALAPERTLTLAEALKMATALQPSLRQAKDALLVAQAKADQVRAGLLPKLDGTASYQRATSNFPPQPGLTPTATTAPSPKFDSFNYWRFGLTASQLVFDSMTTIERF